MNARELKARTILSEEGAIAAPQSRPPTRQRMKLNPLMIVRPLVIRVSKSVKSMLDRHIPMGYEDEGGFHYREK
jgi:hypothetical protein